MRVDIIDDKSGIAYLDDINEVESFCSLHIRPISRGFYRRELTQELKTKGRSFVDYHAGNRRQYEVILNKTGAARVVQAKFFIERPPFAPSRDLKPICEPRPKDRTCPQPEPTTQR